MNNEVLNNKINSIKEAMTNMPKNNIKNKNKYSNYIDNLLIESNELKNKLLKEINDKYQNIINKTKETKNIYTDPRIDKYKEYIILSNTYNTPYEKSNLDKIIDELARFNEEDLNKVNDDIKKAILIFKEVGINLTKDDFNYSVYVNKYMTEFLEELNKDNLDINNLKKCFEEIYWQCPDLIIEISFNLSHLYYQNIKLFEKKYNEIKNKLLEEINLSEKELIDKYKECTNKEEEQEKYSIEKIVNDFLNKSLKINDYEDTKIDSYYQSINDNNKNIEIIKKIKTSLIEYKYYKEYSYIINDILNIYKEKNKYKDIFKNKLKEIKKINNKIIGITKKYLKNEKNRWFYNKDKQKKLLINSENEIINLKNIYEELEINKFYELIFNIDETKTLYDILKISSSYYIYIKELIKKNFEGITNEEIDNKIFEIKQFINNYSILIINNISITEERNIAQIISNKYKLLGVDISSENIENNLETIIDTLEKIILRNIIDNSSITYKDIDFICKVKEIIDK